MVRASFHPIYMKKCETSSFSLYHFPFELHVLSICFCCRQSSSDVVSVICFSSLWFRIASSQCEGWSSLKARFLIRSKPYLTVALTKRLNLADLVWCDAWHPFESLPAWHRGSSPTWDMRTCHIYHIPLIFWLLAIAFSSNFFKTGKKHSLAT